MNPTPEAMPGEQAEMGKLPYIAFYTGDWLKDQVSGCSIAAQGLWLRLMIVAHDAERYGYLSVNGVPIPPERLARMCAVNLEQYTSLLAELADAHVPSWTSDGVMYSRRMVKDARDRAANAQRQANHRAKPVTPLSHPSNGFVTPLSQGYSSSSSSSTSGRGGSALPPTPLISASEAKGTGGKVFVAPTEAELVDHAAIIGLPSWKAIDWWRKMEASGWFIGKQPVRSWRPLCDRVKTQWEADGRPAQQQGYGTKAKGQTKPSLLDLKNVIEAKKVEADRLKLEHSSEVATGVHWNDQNARKEWVKLRSEIKDINHRISTYCDV